MRITLASGDVRRLALSGVLGIALSDTLFFAALRRLGPATLAVVTLMIADAMCANRPPGT